MVDLQKFSVKVREARDRIEGFVRKTPLEYSPFLSEQGQAKVYIKLETEQITGAFKVRGACNKIGLLCEQGYDICEKPPITASSGNHGLACSYAMKMHGAKPTVFSSKVISDAKRGALERVGVELIIYGNDCVDAEVKARETAKKEDRIYISPYNDWDIVAGQGTIGLEVMEQLENVDAIFVPVGGGGIIAGIASYVKSCNEKVKIIGCQPTASKVMCESVLAGHIVSETSEETLSDGTAGGVEEGSITLAMCINYVDEWVLVTEDEIAKAVYFMMEYHHKIVEGSAGVSLGAYIKTANLYKNQNVVIVATGANIGMDKIRAIVNQ